MDETALKQQQLDQLMAIAKYFDIITKQLDFANKRLTQISALVTPILPEIHKLSGKIRRH